MRDDIMRIKEDLCHFMADAAREGIGPHNVEMISAAAVGAEKIMKMAVLEDEMMGEGGYSGRGYSQDGGYSGEDGYSGGYDEGDSYRRGRDPRGRFTRRGYSNDGGYSGEGGYSQAGVYSWRGSYGGGNTRNNEKQNMIQQMRRMAEQAGPEEKKVIEKTIRNLENA